MNMCGKNRPRRVFGLKSASENLESTVSRSKKWTSAVEVGLNAARENRESPTFLRKDSTIERVLTEFRDIKSSVEGMSEERVDQLKRRQSRGLKIRTV